MIKKIKIKLQSLNEQQFDLEDMDIILDNSCIAEIVSVYPSSFIKEYSDQAIWAETATIGQSPVLLQALGMYNIKLPCIVTEVIECGDCPLLCNKCNYFETEQKPFSKYSYCRLHRKRTKKTGSCEQWKERCFEYNIKK